MANVRLKGLSSATKRLADGRRVKYWYAWRGGPRLTGEPGSAEFMAAYQAAVDKRRTPTGRTLATLAALYKASPEWTKNSDSTKRQWIRWLDRIMETDGEAAIGALPWKALDDRRVRAELLAWRDQFAAHPRQADYAMQVLSRVLSWGVDRGYLTLNAAGGTDQLYASSRADRIWSPADIAAYRAAAPSLEVGFIVPLACLTGLRREDLARLAWRHVGELAITLPTGKSRGATTVTVPLLAETRALLTEIRAQQKARHAQLVARALKRGRPTPMPAVTVLANTRGAAWSVNGLEHQVVDAKSAAGVDLHLHDARGAFGTRLRLAGLRASQIADILGWEEKRVERLLAAYVDRDAIIRDLAEQLSRNEKGPVLQTD